MTVVVNSVRKAVEIKWDPAGLVDTEPPVDEKPPGFPAHPIHRPDLKPDQDPPADQPHPEHPIYLPPYIWGPNDPRPGWGLPEIPPEGIDGVPPTVIQKILDFFLGNLPPYDGPDYVAPVDADTVNAVQVFAQGQNGDWSNTAVMPNDGLAVLTYPDDFEGESYVEVRDLCGGLVDYGTIEVEAD